MKIKTVSNLWVKGVGLVAATLLFAGTAFAEPALQIDIDGAGYDNTADVKDVVTSESEFTLLALCDTAVTDQCTGNDGADTTFFFLSIALRDADGNAVSGAGGYGSITVGGTTVNITSDMTYGTPPLDEFYDTNYPAPPADGGDLSPHGAFPTWYYQTAVSFTDANTCGTAQYNVADKEVGDICDRTGSASHYYAFVINVEGLAAGYGLHFDLYNASAFTAICTTTSAKDCTKDSTDFEGYDIDLEKGDVSNAPFSKDASYNCCTKVSEPGTLAMLGIGLLGLGFARRRKSAV